MTDLAGQRERRLKCEIIHDNSPCRAHFLGCCDTLRISAWRLAQQEFSDLNPIKCCPLPQLITNHPEVQRTRVRQVLANPADKAVIVTLHCYWHGIPVLPRIIPDPQPRKVLEDLPSTLGTDPLLGLH